MLTSKSHTNSLDPFLVFVSVHTFHTKSMVFIVVAWCLWRMSPPMWAGWMLGAPLSFQQMANTFCKLVGQRPGREADRPHWISLFGDLPGQVMLISGKGPRIPTRSSETVPNAAQLPENFTRIEWILACESSYVGYNVVVFSHDSKVISKMSPAAFNFKERPCYSGADMLICCYQSNQMTLSGVQSGCLKWFARLHIENTGTSWCGLWAIWAVAHGVCNDVSEAHTKVITVTVYHTYWLCSLCFVIFTCTHMSYHVLVV